VTAEALARAIGERGHRQVAYAGELSAAGERLALEVQEGDVVLTLGAGSVWHAGEELLRRRAAGAGSGTATDPGDAQTGGDKRRSE
jgi:UDP-N-acetylmuramate--alanine ligase